MKRSADASSESTGTPTDPSLSCPAQPGMPSLCALFSDNARAPSPSCATRTPPRRASGQRSTTCKAASPTTWSLCRSRGMARLHTNSRDTRHQTLTIASTCIPLDELTEPVSGVPARQARLHPGLLRLRRRRRRVLHSPTTPVSGPALRRRATSGPFGRRSAHPHRFGGGRAGLGGRSTRTRPPDVRPSRGAQGAETVGGDARPDLRPVLVLVDQVRSWRGRRTGAPNSNARSDRRRNHLASIHEGSSVPRGSGPDRSSAPRGRCQP